MTIVGFNYTKLSVERKNTSPSGNITITNNLGVKDVEKAQLSLGINKQDGLRFMFNYNIKYGDGFAEMNFEGELLYLTNKDQVAEVINSWKTDKKVPDDILVKVLSQVMEKCTLQAIILANEVHLPSPVRLPKLTVKPNQKPEQQSTLSKEEPKEKETKSKKSKK